MLRYLKIWAIIVSLSIFLNGYGAEDSLDDKSYQLPQKDIQRFVTAIALIHHYYIKNISNDTLFDNALQGMVANLDPHSSYLNAEDLKELNTTVSGEFVGVGLELTLSKEGMLKIISPLDGSPAAKAGMKPNDYIIKIDNELVHNMSLEEAVHRIKGRKGTQVILTVLRQGTEKPLKFNLKRDDIHLISVSTKMLEPSYAYARITFFQGPLEKQLQSALNKLKEDSKTPLKGLILDLRNNPGGLLEASAEVTNLFLDPHTINQKFKNIIVSTKGRTQNSDVALKVSGHDILNGAPMIVLINGGSASASEIVAGALQDYKRAIIMGTRSFGKGSVQTVLPIGKNNAIKLTTALYYTPAGREIQAQGIEPDVVVPQLKVNTLPNDSIDVDESDFQNHLVNPDQSNHQKALENGKKQSESEVNLAKTDYQLYEALMMLKGLNAVKN